MGSTDTAAAAIKPAPRGGRKLRREEMERLKAENAELRARLELDAPRDVSMWEATLAQNVRDRMAARALIQEWGDPVRALIRLGFHVELNRGSVVDADAVAILVERIFKTPGCIEILSHDLSDIEGRRNEILARLTEVAIHGDDGEAVRSASQIARMMGWNKPEGETKPFTVNLYNLVGGQRPGVPTTVNATIEQTTDAISVDFLSHEPGGPARIDSGDLPAALEGGH